jgi:hypothetical protein
MLVSTGVDSFLEVAIIKYKKKRILVPPAKSA